MLAHQPVPVVAALGVGVGDADQRPVHRDLLRPQRVGPQRPAPGLDDAGDRRDRRDVREAGDPPGVPALAEQCPGADQHLAVAVLEVRRHQPDPVAALPRADQAAQSWSTRPAARPAASRPARAVREPLPGTPAACPGRRPRSCPVTSIGASGPVSAPSTSAPSIACAEPDCWSSTPVRSAGRVAPARSWSQSTSIRRPVAEVAVLGADDRHDRGGLGLGPGEHPVDRAAAAPDPALGPLVAHRRQRAAYRLDDLLVLGLAGLGEVPLQPVLDEQAPVVGGRLGAVLLGHPGAGRQPEQARVVQPEHGAADLGLLLEQVEPRDGRGHEPGVEPLQERHRPERRSGQLGDQLLEPAGLLLEPVVLLRRRGGEPGELDVRRQVADLDHGRDARAVERRPEQLVDQERLVGRERLGRRRGQAEDHRVRELVEQLAQQPAPDLQQVVALVEDQQQRPGGPELLDEGLAVGVQAGEQALGGRVGGGRDQATGLGAPAPRGADDCR